MILINKIDNLNVDTLKKKGEIMTWVRNTRYTTL